MSAREGFSQASAVSVVLLNVCELRICLVMWLSEFCVTWFKTASFHFTFQFVCFLEVVLIFTCDLNLPVCSDFQSLFFWHMKHWSYTNIIWWSGVISAALNLLYTWATPQSIVIKLSWREKNQMKNALFWRMLHIYAPPAIDFMGPE